MRINLSLPEEFSGIFGIFVVTIFVVISGDIIIMIRCVCEKVEMIIYILCLTFIYNMVPKPSRNVFVELLLRGINMGNLQ